MANPEDNPIKAAVERADRRTRRNARRAIVFSAIALASGGELINHEIHNGWTQDNAAERDELVLSFVGGLVIGSALNYRDARRESKYRSAMYKRGKEE